MGAETDQQVRFERVSRTKGLVFEYVSAAASWLGIVALVVLLAYVLWDALELATAGTTWYLTIGVVFGVPVLAAGWYYYRRRIAGVVALASLAVAAGGTVAALGVLVLFLVLDPAVWFTYVLTFVVPTGLVTAAGYGWGVPEQPKLRPAVLPVGALGLLFGAVATGGIDARTAAYWGVELTVAGGVGALLVVRAAHNPDFGRVGAYAVGATVMGVLVGYGLLGLDTIFGLGFPGPTMLYGAGVVAALAGVTAYVVVHETPAPDRLAGVAVPALFVGATVLGRLLADALAGPLSSPLASAGGAVGGLAPGIWTTYFLTLVVPVALVAGVVARRRELVGDSDRAVALVAGAVLLAALAGSGLVAMLAGDGRPWPLPVLNADIWLVFLVGLFVPAGLFARGIWIEEPEGRAGLVAPLVAVAAFAAAELVVSLVGAAEPEARLDWQYVTSRPSRTPEEAGLYVAIVGSVFIIAFVALFTFPLGVGAAIYLEEYAPDSGWRGRVARVIEVNISNLAGVPSVVYGLLGLGLFVNLVGLGFGTVLVAALTLSLLILPIVIISAREAIRSVPRSMRQASYGMGATRWQTVRNVVLPEAMPGILTGTILALGRAIGETAPLIMVGLPNSIFNVPAGPLSTTSAMPLQIFNWAFRPQPEFRHGVVAAGVVVLLAVLLTMNSIAILVRNRYERTT
jgi:phosphate transport system permease protein